MNVVTSSPPRVREIYSIIKTPLTWRVLQEDLKLIAGEFVDIDSCRNCYIEDNSNSITLLPPNPMKYSSVIFHKFEMIFTVEYIYSNIFEIKDTQLQPFNRQGISTFYLKCYEAENRSKVVAISNNNDYKSYHKMKLPEHFNNTDGVKVYMSKNINGNDMSPKDLIDYIGYEAYYNVAINFQKYIYSSIFIEVVKITLSDIIIDLEWIANDA